MTSNASSACWRLRLAPSATAWNNLGWSLAKLGFYERAVPCFDRAIELDPTMEVARGNRDWAAGQAPGGDGRQSAP